MVSLAEPKERIHFRSKVEAVEQSANRQREFDAFVALAAAGFLSREPQFVPVFSSTTSCGAASFMPAALTRMNRAFSRSCARFAAPR